MKKIILIVMFLTRLTFGQYFPEVEWRSEWDTTVVYKGDKVLSFTPHIKYTHSWVYKKTLLSFLPCAVSHDSRGCPDEWGVEERICSVCLRKEILKERRIIIKSQPNPFIELEKRIQIYLNGAKK